MWTCPQCGEELEDTLSACTKCGEPRDEAAGEEESGATPGILSSKRNCPDCGSKLERIKLIDDGGEAGQREQRYAAADSSRGFLFGRIKTEGVVTARMCTTCGRIVLHGRPDRRPRRRPR